MRDGDRRRPPVSPSRRSSTTCSSRASSTGCRPARSRRSGSGWRCRRARSAPRGARRRSRAASPGPPRPPARLVLVELGGQRSDGSATRREGPPADPSLSSDAQPGQVGLGQRVGQLDHPLLDPAGVGDQDQQQPVLASGTSSTCRTDGAWSATGTARRRPGGSAARAAAPCGPGRRRGRRRRPGSVSMARRSAGRQRLDLREPVDEQPVALVGGDPAGAGVRLGDDSPPPPAPPCRCGSWPGRRPGGAARRAPWSRPARGCARSPRRWRAAPRACGRRAWAPPPSASVWHSRGRSAILRRTAQRTR